MSETKERLGWLVFWLIILCTIIIAKDPINQSSYKRAVFLRTGPNYEDGELIYATPDTIAIPGWSGQ